MPPLPPLSPPPMGAEGPVQAPGALEMGNQINDMLQTMAMQAARKPLASTLIEEAMERLNRARSLDGKLTGRVSHALAVLKGGPEGFRADGNGE